MIIINNKYISVLRTNWIQALEYRANALVGILAILSGLCIEYQIWNFEFNELIVFIFLSIIIGQLNLPGIVLEK